MSRLSKVLASTLAPLLVLTSLSLGASTAYALGADGWTLEQAQSRILSDVNTQRAREGLPPVSADPALNTIAQGCSTVQANNVQMAHCSGYSDQYPAGWHRAAENVAYGQQPDTVVSTWMGSSGHRANILHPEFNRLGVGVAADTNGRLYFTQNFGAYQAYATVPASVNSLEATSGLVSVDLTWGEPVTDGYSGLTGYRISYAPVDGLVGLQHIDVPANTTEYRVNNLEGGKEYNFTVTALNAVGASQSRSVNGTAQGAPTNLFTDYWPNGDGTYTFAWEWNDGGSAVTAQTLTVNGANVAVDADTREHTFAVTPGTEYRVTINASNTYATSVTSQETFITDANAPSVPLNTRFGFEELNSGEVLIAWDAPADNGGDANISYTVRAENTDGEEVASDTTTSRQLILAGLARGVHYYYYVQASNSGGNSDSVSGEFTTPVTSPADVTNVVAELTNERVIDLTWDATTDLGTDAPDANVKPNYTVQVYANGNNTPVHTSTATEDLFITFDSTVIEADTTYTFRVFTHYGTYNSAQGTMSNEVIVPRTPTVPEAPINLEGTSTENSITVTWGEPANGGSAITRYVVSLYINGGVEFKEIYSGEPLTHTFENLNSYTRHTIIVNAINDRGVSSNTSIDVRTLAVAPAAPTNLLPTILPSGSFNISWDAPSSTGGPALTGYEWEIVVDGETIASDTTNLQTIVSPLLAVDKTAEFRVRALNGDRESDWASTTFETAKSASAPNIQVLVLNKDLGATFDFAPLQKGDLALTGYRVYYGPTFEESTYIPFNGGNENRLVISSNLDGLNNSMHGNDVQLAVALVTGAGNVGERSEPIQATVPTIAPGPIQNLVYRTYLDAIQFTYDAPEYWGGPEAGYSYFVTDETGDETIVRGQVTGNALEFQVPSSFFTPGETYILNLTPNNRDFDGITSTLEFTTAPVAPSSPRDLAVTFTGNGSAAVSWNLPANNGGAPITGYSVVYKIADQEPVTVDVDANVTFVGIPNVPANVRLEVSVEAKNSAGTSTPLEDVFQSPYTAPSAPLNANVAVDNRTDDTFGFTLRWDAPIQTGGAEVNELQYSVFVVNSVTGATLLHTATTDSFIELPANLSLTPLEEYRFSVAAANPQHTGFASSPVTATAGLDAPRSVEDVTLTLDPVVNGSLTATASFTHDNLQEWMTDEVSYRVLLYKDGIGAGSYNVDAGETSVNLPGLERNHTYSVIVEATFRGKTTQSDMSSVLTIPALAPEITEVDFTINRNGEVRIDWEAITNGAPVTEYAVTLSDGTATTSINGATEDRNYAIVTLSSMKPNTAYVLTLVLKNSAGNSEAASATARSPYIDPSEVNNLAFDAENGVISWDAPTNNGGDDNLSYSGIIRYSNGDLEAFGSQEELSYTIAGYQVRPGASIEIVITVRGEGGSTSRTITHDEPAIASDPVTDVLLVTTGSTTVAANWNAPVYTGGAPVTGYAWSLLSDGDVIKSGTTTDTYVNIADLAKGLNVTLEVVAINSAGNSDEATSNEVQTEPATNPAVPTRDEMDEAELNEALRTLFNQDASKVRVYVNDFRGSWAFGYLGDGTPLGWALSTEGTPPAGANSRMAFTPLALGTSSFFEFNLSELPEVGDHNIYLLTDEGMLGYGTFTVEAADEETPGGNDGGDNGTPGDNTGGNDDNTDQTPGGNDGRPGDNTNDDTDNKTDDDSTDREVTKGTVKDDKIAETGGDYTWTALFGGLTLLIAGGLVLVTRREKEATKA